MQNASSQKTLKTTYHSSSVDDTCPKQIYSMRAVHFQVNSWMNSLPSRRIQYDGLAQTGVLSYLLWPDASQDNDSDVACLLKVGQAPHTGVWTAATTIPHLPTSLARLFSDETLRHLNVTSCLISAILAVLLIAAAPEEFGIPECTVEAAGLDGPHRWGIILPNSSRVSLVTYKAIVELVLHDQDPIQIGHCVPHDHTAEHGGFFKDFHLFETRSRNRK